MTKENTKNAARILLGTGLIFAGISHLTFARKAFQAQVPDWVPLKKDATVIYSGLAEITLGGLIAFGDQRHKKKWGSLRLFFSRQSFREIYHSIHITGRHSALTLTAKGLSACFSSRF